MKTKAKKNESSKETLTFLQKFSLFFFTRPKKTTLLCLVVVVFGLVSYSSLQKREGFPSVNTPFALSSGTYLVNDAEKIDSEIAKPLGEFLLKQDGVKAVNTQSLSNFYTVQVSYQEEVDAETKSQEIKSKILDQKILPENASINYEAFRFGFTDRGDDLTISFYSKKPVSDEELIQKAEILSSKLKDQNLNLVEDVSIINPYETVTNQQTNQQQKAKKSFERYGEREDGKTEFYNSIIVGVRKVKDSDNIEFDQQVKDALNSAIKDPQLNGFSAEISASNSPQINQQIDELQRTLIEGLIAVLVVGSIVIAIRASLLTVMSMITVIAIVNGLLYIFGYSINTITLFGLILSLALIVDDTIIMVEALEKQKHRQKTAKLAVSVATKKVSRAMIAATLTASLSFVPLIFVSGILGSFIRAIPVTIITALLTSLLVALVFIPLFARKLFFSKAQMKKRNHQLKSANLEAKVAELVSRPMLWAKGSTSRLVAVCSGAFLIGASFIIVGGFLFTKITFNIFPQTKDSNYLTIQTNYLPGTTVEQAEQVSSQVEDITKEIIGDNFVNGAYFGTGNSQGSTMRIELTDYKNRDVKAPELVDKLKDRFKNYDKATVLAGQIDAGPPASDFAARINSSENREGALRLANDISNFLKSTELKRLSGEVAKIESVSPADATVYSRADGQQYLSVRASFEDSDTTTLVTLAQTAVEKEFTPERVKSYGLESDALNFDFGQESENQESFKNLLVAFPIVLLAIYILLAVQFRSLMQPLLIFMAIPFSLFGVTGGLYITDNPFSFFAMLGFFALIGLSIKNTILLTDYANQALKEGKHVVDAAHLALEERFRPLMATSLTAIVSLIPLALNSPFWESLSVVLIFGLMSSTFLVVTVFPYYYLVTEFLRRQTSRLFKKHILRKTI